MSVVTRLHHDASERLIVAQRIQDVEDILEHNKYLADQKQTFAGTWHHIGEIPNVIIEKWLNEDGIMLASLVGDDFGKWVKRKLRDPDNAAWRVTDKRF
jgi:hypothetical protein